MQTRRRWYIHWWSSVDRRKERETDRQTDGRTDQNVNIGN